jgi:hypothetical protein
LPTIDHVVVLMFENRSFDHMLGLLSDDPGFPGVRLADDRFSVPADPTDPSKGRVGVTGDATFGLAVDPPHSHGSVVEQLGLGHGSGPSMDGFVSAYARKLAGHEAGLPVVHWRRIGGLAAVAIVVFAAVLALPRAVPLAAGLVGLLAVSEGLVGWAYRRRRTLPVNGWTAAFAVPAVLVVVGGAVSAALGAIIGFPLRWAVFAALLAIAAYVVVSRKRRTLERAPVGHGEASQIMRCMNPMERLPALASLASSFALCTRWHCSVPGATWPNRNFAHAGTSDGTVDIEIGFYDNPTIFHRLHEAGRSWCIYRDRRSLAQVMAFGWLSDEDQIANWRRLDEFADDARLGRLAAYSFIEPAHDGPRSNSQHPGNNDADRQPGAGELSDFERGENLIVEVYEALRANPEVFARTLLVITYDEHGGFYDHVAPPTDAVEPEPFGTAPRSWMPRAVGWFVEQPDSRFRFNVLGPRVPTVVVSPRVPAGWVDTCFDHSAIPRTVRELFAPTTASLSAREEASPSFGGLASLADPRTDLPDLSRFAKPEIAARGPAVPTPPPHRDDEFDRQLRQLGQAMAAKLGVAARGDEGSLDEIAELFTARADAARGRG